MAAYVIVNIRVTDPGRYEEYRRLAGPTVSAHGGRFLVRGGSVEVLEGGWKPSRLVVLEFPSAARARQWWSSAEYGEAMKIRHATAETEMVLVEGA